MLYTDCRSEALGRVGMSEGCKQLTRLSGQLLKSHNPLLSSGSGLATTTRAAGAAGTATLVRSLVPQLQAALDAEKHGMAGLIAGEHLEERAPH